jgi:hypothetical protein
MWREDGRGTTVKGNYGSKWSSDDLVLWLGRRQNGDMIELRGEWSRLRWSFYSSGGWESDGPGRMACCGGADSMLRCRLEMGNDRMKLCHKMKWRQRVHLGSMWRNYNTVQQCGDIGWRKGGTGEGKGRRRRQLAWHKSYSAKNEENPRSLFSWFKWMMKI